MSDIEDTIEKADREKREFTDHAIEQIAKTQNVTPFMFTGGTLTHDAITHLASSLARVERTLSREPVSHDSRDLMIDDLIQRVDRQSRRIDSLELDIVALRSSQQLADPTGAHPYRSPVISATAKPRDRVYVSADHPDYPYAAAPSSPMATSDALERVEGRPGALRRVYGGLDGVRGPVAAMAGGLLVALIGVICSGVLCLAGSALLVFSTFWMTNRVLSDRWSAS